MGTAGPDPLTGDRRRNAIFINHSFSRSNHSFSGRRPMRNLSLENVRRSKRRIEDATPPGPGYNVKLGRGGIREIEFIAQALQLAYGGRDEWLRHPHTLVSFRVWPTAGLIAEKDLTGLFEAYEFLRRSSTCFRWNTACKRTPFQKARPPTNCSHAAPVLRPLVNWTMRLRETPRMCSGFSKRCSVKLIGRPERRLNLNKRESAAATVPTEPFSSTTNSQMSRHILHRSIPPLPSLAMLSHRHSSRL